VCTHKYIYPGGIGPEFRKKRKIGPLLTRTCLRGILYKSIDLNLNIHSFCIDINSGAQPPHNRSQFIFPRISFLAIHLSSLDIDIEDDMSTLRPVDNCIRFVEHRACIGGDVCLHTSSPLMWEPRWDTSLHGAILQAAHLERSCVLAMCVFWLFEYPLPFIPPLLLGQPRCLPLSRARSRLLRSLQGFRLSPNDRCRHRAAASHRPR